MNFNFSSIEKKLPAAVAFLFFATSCVYINSEVGKDFIPTNHQYDIRTAEFYLDEITMLPTDSLSGYSSSRITIGAVRDDVFGNTERASAFTLVPISNSLDFGENTKFRQFHFSVAKDTTSYPDDSQKNIIQNINVYTLDDQIGENDVYVNSGEKLKIGKRISKGIPLYAGGDSLSFDFTEEFGQFYIDKLKTMKLDSLGNYVKDLPGIYLSVDPQTSNGGRINMFDLAIALEETYYITGNFAELKFTADYGTREAVDTSFIFFFGAQDMAIYQEAESIYESSTKTQQFALNVSYHESFDSGLIRPEAGEKIYVEGGGGVKPVISSKEIQTKCLEIFNENGIDNPEGVIINKATLVLPYEFPANYENLKLYPARLSPTCKIRTTDSDDETKKYVAYAGLTDASVSTENQGDINKSMNMYSPDISHHVQEILTRVDDDNAASYDIWLLLMASEVTQTSSDTGMSEYYQNLMYYNYYNNLYGGYGYGGYGGYGNYGGYGYDSYYGYNNYINYMLAAQYSSGQTSTSTSVQLDKDRYYNAVLYGPDAADEAKRPKIKITYSVARK